MDNNKNNGLSFQEKMSVLGGFGILLGIFDKAMSGLLGCQLNYKYWGYLSVSNFSNWNFIALKSANYVCGILFVLAGFASFMFLFEYFTRVFRIKIKPEAPFYKMKNSAPTLMRGLYACGANVIVLTILVEVILLANHRLVNERFVPYFGLGVFLSIVMFGMIELGDINKFTFEKIILLLCIDFIFLGIVFISFLSVFPLTSDFVLNMSHFQYQYSSKSRSRLIINADCLSNIQLNTGNKVLECASKYSDFCYQSINGKQILLEVSNGVYVPTIDLLIVRHNAYEYPLDLKTCKVIFQP